MRSDKYSIYLVQRKIRTGQLFSISTKQVKTVSSFVDCNIHVATGRSKKGDVAVRIIGVVIGWDSYDMSDLCSGK
jgi:phosphatidylserine decarboxylase